MTNRLIILDRDGVINEDSDDYIKSPEEWIPVPGSIDAISRLSSAGYTLVVATNQSGLGRGLFDTYALARMHEKMHRLVEDAGGRISGVFYCPHTPEKNCRCRKPATGLLDRIEKELALDVAGAWYIGDSEKDIDCAEKAQCIPVLVMTGKGRNTLDTLSSEKRERILIFDNLAAATDHILSETTGKATS